MSEGEVTIVCQVDTLHLPDLGLRLTRGARVSVPLSAAMKSRDLSKAKVDGTVITQTLRSSVIRAQESVSLDAAAPQPPRASNSLDLSPLLSALQALTEEVRALRADLKFRPPIPAPPPIDLSPLVKQLERSLFSNGSTQPRAVQNPPEEVFIPSNLTGSDLSANLNVASESSDDPGLADALKALKAAKKKR